MRGLNLGSYAVAFTGDTHGARNQECEEGKFKDKVGEGVVGDCKGAKPEGWTGEIRSHGKEKFRQHIAGLGHDDRNDT